METRQQHGCRWGRTGHGAGSSMVSLALIVAAVAGCERGLYVAVDAGVSGPRDGALTDALAPHCTDSVKQDDESDLDCGGPYCVPCEGGHACLVDRDCVSGICRGGTCVAAASWFIDDGLDEVMALPDGATPRAWLVPADFNADGRLDLFFVVDAPAGEAAFLFNSGGATFRRAGFHRVGRSPSCAAAADFNEDGFPDVAVALYDGIWLGMTDGKGGISSYSLTSVVKESPGLDVADLDGDGHVDVLATDPTGKAMALFHGRGDGSIGGKPTRIALGDQPRFVRVRDLDGNGVLDMVTSGYGFLAVTLRDKAGVLKEARYAAARDVSVANVGDVDGDRLPDVTVGFPAQDVKSAVAALFQNDGDGLLVRRADIWSGSDDRGGAPLSTLADVNGDGALDAVVLRLSPGSLFIALGRGDGSFVTANEIALFAHGLRLDPRFMVTGDFDGDGRDDIVVAAGGRLYVLRARAR